MRILTTCLTLAAAAALLLFPFCYHFLTGGTWRRLGAWRDTSAGVHVMCFMGVLGAVMGLVVARIVGVDLPEWVRPVVWGSIAVVAWWRLILLFVLQRRRD